MMILEVINKVVWKDLEFISIYHLQDIYQVKLEKNMV